ncbi:aldehyde dehydrogenase family protein [Demequina capsici]|uniref:Aldehyde dehydrogenase family protein n=1 Tax=Demequina capsici TaxID=3075620 RepID=A0AA96F863_9MICO|nr:MULTISPECIES: aldehyde dehydrogenase family protein [unclassified Demequina]WNM24415.1 aldehyde dehydrogenase family protein [Demequina sp. OYTSA14]WNM27249.1 aldehyde dehydrogenase family protein [Demequina sp. PMTSA13]
MAFFDQGMWEGSTYLGGWTHLGRTADAVSPSTGESVGTFALAEAGDVQTAVDLAASAQRTWAAASPEERSAVMRRAALLIEQHVDVLARWLGDEAGSAPGKAAFEAGLVASEYHLASATAMMPYGQLLRTGRPRMSLARRLPVGVVGVIAPFNFPAILAARSIAPALALGNAVVLKPDPRTTIAGGLFLAAVLEEAGLPPGLFNVVPGGADVGIALVDEPRVPVISFTGSTPAGRAIAARGGQLLKRVHLELGGNNALVVLEDADVEAAASAGAWGSFLHQGQICMTTGRHLVHESLYDRYVELLAEKAGHIVAGPPDTGAPLGPIIDRGQRDKVHSIVGRSVEAGARLVVGGTYEGLFYQPSVLADVSPGVAAFEEEIFGPVASVTPFSTIDQLVQLVNSSPFGLSLGILTGDAYKAFELSDRMRTGIVHINDQTVDDEAQAPFGGVGDSGTGVRFGGHEANIEAFTETQWVTMQGEIAAYPF